jgi:hypothetical protein
MTPYNTGKISIGKDYVKPFEPVRFTRDEEIIQDLLLGNKIPASQQDLTVLWAVVMAIGALLIGVFK